MNSLIVFLPIDVDGESIASVVESVRGLSGVTSTSASRGTQERVYWDKHLEVLREYEPEERADAEVRTKGLTPWVFDYTGGVALVRDLVAAVANSWHSIWIDNDAEPMMAGDEYLARLQSDPAWDWTLRHANESAPQDRESDFPP